MLFSVMDSSFFYGRKNIPKVELQEKLKHQTLRMTRKMRLKTMRSTSVSVVLDSHRILFQTASINRIFYRYLIMCQVGTPSMSRILCILLLSGSDYLPCEELDKMIISAIGNEEQIESATGNGPVDALYQCIYRVTGYDIVLDKENT